MKKIKKKISIVLSIILFSLLFFIPIYSTDTCTSIPDEYIVTCNIPKHYFNQEFTCLNSDCSNKLEKNSTFLDLYIDNKKTSIIFQNYINLNDIKNDLEIINNICVEKFSKDTLNILDEKLKIYETSKWKFMSGEKITISPTSIKDEKQIIAEYNKKENYLEQCYNLKPEIYEEWIIASKTKKSYCEISYNEEKDCFITEINNFKFLSFLIFNPSLTTLGYIISFLFSGLIIILIFDTIFYLIKNEKLKEFFKLNNKKAIYFSLILIPSLYLYGSIIDYLVNKRFYWYVNSFTEIILIVIAMLFLYFIICLITYLRNKKNI